MKATQRLYNIITNQYSDQLKILSRYSHPFIYSGIFSLINPFSVATIFAKSGHILISGIQGFLNQSMWYIDRISWQFIHSELTYKSLNFIRSHPIFIRVLILYWLFLLIFYIFGMIVNDKAEGLYLVVSSAADHIVL